MLNSGSEYLHELHEEYKDKMMCSDRNMLNENIIPVDEKQVSDIIDKVCNQTKQNENVANENEMNQASGAAAAVACSSNHDQSVRKTDGHGHEIHVSKNFDATPDQIKMIAYDSSNTRARGLDTDKENV